MPPLPIDSQPDLVPIVRAAATISAATTRPTIVEPVRRVSLALSRSFTGASRVAAGAALSDAAIRVQPAEDIVPEVGKDDRAERNEQDDRAPAAPPPTYGAGMEA